MVLLIAKDSVADCDGLGASEFDFGEAISCCDLEGAVDTTEIPGRTRSNARLI